MELFESTSLLYSFRVVLLVLGIIGPFVLVNNRIASELTARLDARVGIGLGSAIFVEPLARYLKAISRTTIQKITASEVLDVFLYVPLTIGLFAFSPYGWLATPRQDPTGIDDFVLIFVVNTIVLTFVGAVWCENGDFRIMFKAGTIRLLGIVCEAISCTGVIQGASGLTWDEISQVNEPFGFGIGLIISILGALIYIASVEMAYTSVELYRPRREGLGLLFRSAARELERFLLLSIGVTIFVGAPKPDLFGEIVDPVALRFFCLLLIAGLLYIILEVVKKCFPAFRASQNLRFLIKFLLPLAALYSFFSLAMKGIGLSW